MTGCAVNGRSVGTSLGQVVEERLGTRDVFQDEFKTKSNPSVLVTNQSTFWFLRNKDGN